MVRQVFCAGFLGAAIWLGAPAPAVAQQSCSGSNPETCTLTGGPYSNPVSIAGTNGNPLNVTTNATVSVNAQGATSPLTILNDAPAGTSAASQGSNANGLTITNYGPLSVAFSDAGNFFLNAPNNYFFGIYSLMLGGQGYNGNPSKNGTLNGGDTAHLSFSNYNNITLSLPSVYLYGGSGLYGLSQAGAGGSNGSGTGGAGGNSGGASLANSGTINISVGTDFGQSGGVVGFGGIEALARGGFAGTGDNGAFGGTGGVATVISAAPVTLNYNWYGVGSTDFGLFGILAQSKGGGGTGTKGNNNSTSGGFGGSAGSAAVTLGQGGNVSVTDFNSSPSGGLGGGCSSCFAKDVTGAGVAAEAIGGDGGNGEEQGLPAGNGGNAQPGGQVVQAAVVINITDANVSTSGSGLPGLLAYGQGGNGGLGATENDGSFSNSADSNGGVGGSVDSVNINGIAQSGMVAIVAQNQNVQISTNGANSPAIVALLQGGVGGLANQSQHIFKAMGGGAGGRGGNVYGADTITLTGLGNETVTLMTAGSNAPGIFALSAGGAGGDGGEYTATLGGGTGGAGGDGGQGGPITVTLQNAVIGTKGASSPGIFAQSQGANGGDGGPSDALKDGGGNGGNGGASGAVTISLDSGSKITTQGSDSSGIIAQSFSGAGGDGGAPGGLKQTGGNGGMGGDAGAISVTNGGVITTSGDNSRGILAQSLSGAGGGGGGTAPSFSGKGGSGASSGNAGDVTVVNQGAITTSGANAEGILAQSIGGSGGAGGSASGFKAVGGTVSTNPFTSNGGTVEINAENEGGNITTSGVSAIGILGQSIGGGGGDGGGASGVAVAVGGNGGAGGSGGDVGTNLQGASITTSGDGAHGIVLQSIGGGGGNAGNASSGGVFASVSLGGSGGSGGSGGTVELNPTYVNVTTSGSGAAGLVAQSVGGGGGAGGKAFSGSIGAGFDASVSIGGSGGPGSDGGIVQSQVTGGTIMTGQNPLLIQNTQSQFGQGQYSGTSCTALPCNLLPTDAYGVDIQSIGGGGGLGGSASAQALALSIPVTPSGTQVSVAASVSLGGSGGSGGSGSLAQFALSTGGTITTSGQGSTAVLVQSIGGGGGAGGDSSALAAALGFGQTVPDNASSVDLTATFSVGGSGGNGGNGGPVAVAIGGTVVNESSLQPDPSGSAATAITTYGDYADGITAQSVGGGGGNAGTGSGNTQFFGSGNNLTVSVTLGSKGGTGGTGGPVTVSLFPGNGITTYGSGAIGIIAQSIGGGGGTSQGGSYTFGVTKSVGMSGDTVRPSVTVNVGENGGTGNSGGPVTVTAAAPITTHGGNATGILAQSIGGSGGLAGSSGSDASADNPIVAALAAREGESSFESLLTKGIENTGVSFDGTLAVSVGGTGGTGGNGNPVTVNLSAPITTTGDWANGVVAQSIAGGGGAGGSAIATGTGGIPEVTLNLDVAVGGKGGSGSYGNVVSVNLNQGNTAIKTAGFGAAGILAQSIGGGGGLGADGSDSATGLLSVGGATGGKGGVGGSGGTVNVNTQNPNGSKIATTGAAADGVVLQSVGGGGGIAGAGSSLFKGAWKASSSLGLSAGGSSAASGVGYLVTFAGGGPIAISTTGIDSFGILAQSIGGGGGSIISQPSSTSISSTLGGGEGNGDTVNVTLNSQSAITTSGIGSNGIVAQSIGGGGGVIRVVNAATDTPSLTTYMGGVNGGGAGSGGNVTVESDGTIAVAGAGAVGILAQSIGGGGGLVTNGLGGFIHAGTVKGSSGSGGTVIVTTNGPVTASGLYGIGIFGQSTGPTNGGQVQVTVNSRVFGGTGTGATYSQPGSAAVVVDSPSGNTYNQVTVNGGGSLNTESGVDGVAILASGGGYANVNVMGTITGSIAVNGGTVSVNGGTLYPGPMIDGAVLNSGTVNLRSPAAASPITTVTGNFTQTSSGRLGVTVDSLNNAASQLHVNGTASLDGLIVPSAISLLPGTVPVVTAGNLTTSARTLDSLLFHWSAARLGNTLTLSPSRNFAPGGVSLTGSESSLAGYLSTAWDRSTPFFARLFADLSRINDGGQYKTTLDSYSPKAAEAQSLALINSAGTILGAAMSCPVFVDNTVLLGEDSCLWLSVTGGLSTQGTTSETPGYRVSGVTYRVGGQGEIAPDWYLGASVATGQTWATGNGITSGNGRIFDGSLALKHTMGPWLFAGSLAFASGAFEDDRAISLPGTSASLQSKPGIFLAGGRLRAGYEFAFKDWYIRPYGDFDVLYTNLSRFQEAGSAQFGVGSSRVNYALNVRGSDKTTVAFSPMVEFGGRLRLDAKTTLRPFVAMGVSFLPDNERTLDASFADAPADLGTFRSFLKSPGVLGNVDLGVQLYRAGGLDIKAEYSVSVGDSFLSQSGSARIAYHF